MHRFVAILALLVTPPSAIAAGFVSLDLPGSQLAALSRDGCVAAGSLLGGQTAGFRWSAATGTELLAEAVTVQGLSASGDYVAGATLDPWQRQVASYWDAHGAVHRLPAMPGTETIGVVSLAYAVSDEPRVVGSARRPRQGTIAFEWTAATGMRALAAGEDGAAAAALAVSDDGERIVGWLRAGQDHRPAIWRHGHLLARPADTLGEVLGISRSTEVLVGMAAGPDTGLAYRWHADGSHRLLKPPAATGTTLRLYASSDDGRVLAGATDRGSQGEPWVWLENGGFVSLDALLAQRRIAVPADWQLLMLTAVSSNGQRLGGWGKRRDGALDSFVVDLSGEAAMACTATRAGAVSRTGGRTP